MNTFLMTIIFISTFATGNALVILAGGLMVAIHALEGDVSMSDDHPLVKRQGLPI